MTIRSVPFALAAAAVAVSSGTAFAQVLVPVSQTRFVSGQNSFTDPSGTVESGPLLIESPPGNFGPWPADLVVPGVVSGNASQEGGLLGEDRIQLNRFSMTMGGGNGPGTSGSGEMRNEFTYTFTVAAGTTYTFNCNIGCAGPGGAPGTSNDWSVTVSLVKGSTDEFRFQTGFDNGFNLAIGNVEGTLTGGDYTLSVVGTGVVTFDGGATGAGTGGGAGGVEPAMSFVVTAPVPPQCPADLGMAGGVPGQDGVLDNNDFIAFINYFFESDARADVGTAGGLPGSDGQWDNNDFIAFIDLFFSGC